MDLTLCLYGHPGLLVAEAVLGADFVLQRSYLY